MRFDVITIFPQIFRGYLGQSLLAKAIDKGRVSVGIYDLRDWASGPHRSVDDRPYGGGPGMVLKVEPIVTCVEDLQKQGEPGHVVLLTPKGRRLDQRVVEELAGYQRVLLLCGRYEGFDQRVVEILCPDEISIGDYVLNGGEVAAMVVVDAVIRLVPGVLGDQHSGYDDSFSRGNRLLEYAQYTRPRDFRGYRVPDVLLSGDHDKIARWREEQRYLTTHERRHDLLKRRGES
jgi:tRNA (guanine37-N1)-methyltransferase